MTPLTDIQRANKGIDILQRNLDNIVKEDVLTRDFVTSASLGFVRITFWLMWIVRLLLIREIRASGHINFLPPDGHGSIYKESEHTDNQI